MLRKLAAGRPRLFLFVSYALLVLLVTLVLFWRFPNNVVYDNFYAEDGSVFLQNILDKGWLSAIFTPFNGYFVVGLYGLEAIAWMLNAIFGEGLLTLPAYFALASIMLMAAVIALPFLLFSNLFGRLKMLAVVVFGALLPLPLSPHIAIGTVGNQKWIFFYLALLLVLYRLFHSKRLSWQRAIVIDAAILVCAYTNATTYTLIPLLFIPYIRDAYTHHKKSLVQALMKQLRRKEVLSLVALAALLLPQVIYVALNGIPAQPGYLDTAYQAAKTVEVFINRTYLFGVTHLFNGYLSDWLAIALMAGFVFVGIKLLTGRERIVFFTSLYAAFMATALFVINRPGVTDFFAGYSNSGSGPDQFFYAQTLIMYFPIVLVAFAVGRWANHRWVGKSLLVAFVLLVVGSGLASNVFYGERWRNASVFENDAGTFIDQSIDSCQKQSGQQLSIAVYPYATGQFSLKTDRDMVCNQTLKHYQDSAQNIGLAPDNNNFREIKGDTKLSQTLVSTQPRLEGIRLYLATFNNPSREGTYELTVYNSGCQKELRRAAIPSRLVDNTWFSARFVPLDDSQGKTYCFAVTPPKSKSFDVLAVQLSAPNVYVKGDLKIDEARLPEDIVFTPLYTQAKP